MSRHEHLTSLCLAAARPQVSAAVLALALTHVLQLTGMLQWWVRQTAEVENTMTSVERLLEYTRLPQEPPRWDRLVLCIPLLPSPHAPLATCCVQHHCGSHVLCNHACCVVVCSCFPPSDPGSL